MLNAAADNECRMAWRRHARLTAAKVTVKMIVEAVGQDRGRTAMPLWPIIVAAIVLFIA
jgi:hypothetical protein